MAYTTARKIYFVVTKGIGALSNREQAEINVSKVNTQLNSTPNEPATFLNIPTSNGQSSSYLNLNKSTYKDLNSSNERKKNRALAEISDPFYAVDLSFNVDIVVKKDLSLEDISRKIAMNPNLYGVILNIVSNDAISKLNVSSTIQDLIKDANRQFDSHNGSDEGEAEAYGSIKSLQNKSGIDMIIFNSNNKNISLNMTDRIGHEIGHNFTNNSHSDTYHYRQRGLQSNSPGSIVPNSKNKIDIILNSKMQDIYDKLVFNPDQTHV